MFSNLHNVRRGDHAGQNDRTCIDFSNMFCQPIKKRKMLDKRNKRGVYAQASGFYRIVIHGQLVAFSLYFLFPFAQNFFFCFCAFLVHLDYIYARFFFFFIFASIVRVEEGKLMTWEKKKKFSGRPMMSRAEVTAVKCASSRHHQQSPGCIQLVTFSTSPFFFMYLYSVSLRSSRSCCLVSYFMSIKPSSLIFL